NLRHPLHSLKAHAIARRQDRDDVLFEINDHGFKLAVVHLTWRQVTETNPKWPATALFASWSQWIESMKRDHEEWSLQGLGERQRCRALALLAAGLGFRPRRAGARCVAADFPSACRKSPIERTRGLQLRALGGEGAGESGVLGPESGLNEGQTEDVALGVTAA